MIYYENIKGSLIRKKDKHLHGLIGDIFGLAMLVVSMAKFDDDLFISLLVCFLSKFILGVAKEIYDYLDYGVFDKQDIIATTLPYIIWSNLEALYLKLR